MGGGPIAAGYYCDEFSFITAHTGIAFVEICRQRSLSQVVEME
jgi:hypothetical protein